MRIASILLAAFASVSVHFPAAAVTTNFSTGTEGWTLGDADNPAVFPVGNGTLSWNPGYITGTENAGGPINVFFAPPSYLGNQSSAYGSTISFDLRAQSTTDGTAYSAVYLFGNGQVISNASTFPATGSSFTNFSFNLNETSGWRIYTGGGYYGSTSVDQATFQAILANLTNVGIMMDWLTGFDTIDLAQVSFGPNSAVPVPAALPLFATALIGGGVIAWRKRRKQKAEPIAA